MQATKKKKKEENTASLITLDIRRETIYVVEETPGTESKVLGQHAHPFQQRAWEGIYRRGEDDFQ